MTCSSLSPRLRRGKRDIFNNKPALCLLIFSCRSNKNIHKTMKQNSRCSSLRHLLFFDVI